MSAKTVAATTAGLAWLTFGLTEGVGFILFLIFGAQKLWADNSIAGWSWWEITSPLWAGALVSLAFTVVAIIAALVHLARD